MYPIQRWYNYNNATQACYDSIQAGIGEAQSSHDKALCLGTLVKIAKHFDVQDILQPASEGMAWQLVLYVSKVPVVN